MNQAIKKRIEDINNEIVPKGYKKTPFGIFPCDWETTSIGEVSINKGEYGLNAPACEYESGLPKYIRITDIDDNGNYVDTGACVDFQDVTKQYTLKEGDVVFARTGATVGRNYLYKEKDGELLYAGFLIKFSINKNVANPYIVYANSNTKQYWNWIKKISARSGQPGVNAEEYSQYRFVKAKDKVEQGKIAEILIKWDEMVELQEQYIQKLELRKKAIMKKLLTPKDSWKKCKLKDFIKVKSGYAFKSETYVENGKYQILTIKNVQCGVLDLNEISTISELPSNIQKHQILALDDIIISLTGNVGRSCYITKENCLLNQRVGKVECSNVYKQFVYAILQTDDFINAMINIAQGGAQANLSNEDVENFEFFVPFVGNHLDENIIYKLGQINLIIDEEISLQKEKLEKIKIQRKAMQQYLLTGIVRVGKLMDEKYVDEYYEFLIRNEERLKNDEEMVRETLASHLSHVPEKLYKYRTCTMQNFRTLKEGNIYMPRADAFKDPFDYTLNFDLSKNVDNMHAFFLKHIDQLVYSAIKGILQQNRVIVPDFSIEDVRYIRENYFLEDGTRLTEKVEQDIMSKGTNVDNVLYRNSQDLVEYYLKDGSLQLIGLCERLAEDINRVSREPRDTTLVYCMTEDKSCGPMWENYADGYTGFCIEYDFSNWEDKPFDEIKNLIYLLPVIYLKEKPVFNMELFFELATRQFVFGEKIGENIPLQIDLNKQLLRKQSDYDYEKEWRFSIKNEGNHLQPFSFVSAIYMGKDILEKDVKHLKVVAKKLKIPLYKQTLNCFGNEFRYEEVKL